MPVAPRHLVNSEHVEAWPAWLLRPRANADARTLAGAAWCLRRKRDGRFLAAFDGRRLWALLPRLDREPGVAAAIAAIGARHERAAEALHLPLHGLGERLRALGLDQDYGERTGLALVAEPARLELAGFDRYRRPLWLRAPAARAWARLRASAGAVGIRLEAISGYRSHAYQLGIFERKLARGLTVPEILAVNAAPGYSEHHGGLALDIGTPGEPPAEESFEATPAFAWLRARAGDFGFRLSYPRDNPHGIVYEPWHWCWHPPAKERA